MLICCYCLLSSLYAQDSYWQQQVNYTIDVTLDDKAHALDGYIKINYYNNSSDTLHFIWFHLWPNAYKNDRTAFSDQLLENGRTDFYFSNNDKRGYINRLDFKVNKITARTEDHPQHQDIVKLVLPESLPPKASILIETPFHVKLPYNFSRGGHIRESYQLTQWYPKPAVYDKYGWHEMPYLDQGEFYSEFGNYDVSISVPKKYIVASTGVLQQQETDTANATLHYKQENVHDFAWFADKDFMISHDTLQLSTGSIDVYAYYNKANKDQWKNAIGYIKSAIRTKSNWVGGYPYKTVSVVESPQKGDGGMEYPTITLISSPGNDKSLDYLINHEVGHNWFYGILGSNEREHPWMDEGMNTYYDNRYARQQYGKQDADVIDIKVPFIRNRMPEDPTHTVLQTMTAVKKDQPIETTADRFNMYNYNVVAYTKTGDWMKLLEKEIGQDTFDKLMHEYFNRWKFRHPYPEDFKLLAEEISGKSLDSTFALLKSKGNIESPVKKDTRLASFFSMKNTDRHHYIFISPAAGYNFYDKFMAGLLIHNYTLAPTRLQFVIAPLYGTKSKSLNGIGRVSYSFYPANNGQKLELAVAGARFNGDEFTDSTNTINYLQFSKIVPSIKYVFANRNPRSSVMKYIQWKTFLINETSLLFTRDTVQQIDIITYPVNHRYLNQLQFVFENNRKLYPYRAAFQAEQGDGFLRLNLTGNYYFNYGQTGGLNVRFFAGKFIYLGDQTFIKQFETDQYHLNLTGPKGYEDYTYSNYYVGRNEFDKFSSQQIMIRDGAFKVRTDLLSSKIGKTDNWLSALNFTTTIPKEINPLELLPVKIPIRAFVDIGTYAEAWKKDAPTGRFLYDAGLQLSLFRNVLNIYVPLLYSKVYRDYFKSTIPEKRFWKTISFSIDIQNIALRRIFPQSPF